MEMITKEMVVEQLELGNCMFTYFHCSRCDSPILWNILTPELVELSLPCKKMLCSISVNRTMDEFLNFFNSRTDIARGAMWKRFVDEELPE